MKLAKKENTAAGEVLYFGKHPSGLDIIIVPKPGYSSTYAIFGTKYGSVDSEFVVPGDTEATKVPDGIAHYLEHKMFDQPDGSNVFDKFSTYGGNANAFTSFNMTAYLFSATSNIEENLAALLDYVQSPYFTKESVEKEQGIIGQEIRMYDDSGTWRVFFNFLECLYNEHPVKKDIAGTVESISHITADYLYKCYNTFYNLSNMALVVVGNAEPEKILETIEHGIKENKPFKEEIKRIYPKESEKIAKPYAEQKLSVAAPLFMTGFKDNDTGYDGEALLKKDIEMNVLLRMIFGKSSRLYKKLYESGLINPQFEFEYTMQPDYGFSSVSGESKNPKKVYELMIEEIEKLRTEGLDESAYERSKKVIWGEYIRTHNDVEEYAGNLLRLHFMNIDFSDYGKVYKSVTFDSVKKRFEEHFKKENSALSVVNPI